MLLTFKEILGGLLKIFKTNVVEKNFEIVWLHSKHIFVKMFAECLTNHTKITRNFKIILMKDEWKMVSFL